MHTHFHEIGARTLQHAARPLAIFVVLLMLSTSCTERQEEEPKAESHVEPAATVSTYWRALEQKEFDLAWQQLSDDFRKRNFESDTARFKSSMETMQLCAAVVQVLKVNKAQGGQAREVIVELTLERGKNCKAETSRYAFDLVRSKQDAQWTIQRARIL